ncbi:MAG: ATPase, T2SS/T4P/T4SS family, partial [Novipirellula sp. JB048]
MAKSEEPVQLWQTVTPVEFVPQIEDRNEAQALLISTRQEVGYQIAGGQLGHAVQSRATHVLLDYSQTACAIRYQVDGIWEQLPPLDRETGDAMLYALKQLCLLNPADRRTAQAGELGLKLAKEKFTLTLQSQGVPTGERVLLRIESEKVPFEKLADLGMRDRMVAALKEKLDRSGNMVLVTAPKGEGLTTTWMVTVNASDRLIRDFQSFEEQSRPEPEIINVSPNFYGGDTGLTLIDIVNRLILREPDVLMFPDLPDDAAMAVAVEHVANTEKSVMTRMNAPSAMEAYVQFVSKYKASAKEVASF